MLAAIPVVSILKVSAINSLSSGFLTPFTSPNALVSGIKASAMVLWAFCSK